MSQITARGSPLSLEFVKCAQEERDRLERFQDTVIPLVNLIYDETLVGVMDNMEAEGLEIMTNQVKFAARVGTTFMQRVHETFEEEP